MSYFTREGKRNTLDGTLKKLFFLSFQKQQFKQINRPSLMSMSHFQYKLTTKAGNLVLNLEEKAEKKKKYKIIHAFFQACNITSDQKRTRSFQHRRS